jgi:hypothetical protein
MQWRCGYFHACDTRHKLPCDQRFAIAIWPRELGQGIRGSDEPSRREFGLATLSGVSETAAPLGARISS